MTNKLFDSTTLCCCAAPQQVFTEGGWASGSPYNILCPPGTYVTSFPISKNSANWIGSVGPIGCSDGSTVGVILGIQFTTQQYTDASSSGYTGLTVRAGMVLDRLTFAPSGNTYGGDGGGPKPPMNCPAGTQVVGIFGVHAVAYYVITMGLYCAAICPTGNTCGSAGACVDIDECALGTSTCDLAVSTCVNTPGSFTCPCKPGYISDFNKCVPDCAINNGGCSQYATCKISFGVRRCTCNACFTVGNGLATDQPGGTGCSYSLANTVTSSTADPSTYPTITAGSEVPVKFTLKCDAGLNILQSGYPKVLPIDCTTSVPTAAAVSATAGSSGLQYNSVTKTYTYAWKTPSDGVSGNCVVLQFAFVGDTSPVKAFTYKYA